MPPRSSRVPPPAPDTADLAEPPYYEATEDLMIGNPESGAMPVAAFRAGSRVDPSLVELNGWGGKVRVPDQFAGQLTIPPPPEEPEPPADDTVAADAAGKE